MGAATALSEKDNFKVTVLEGRDRAGGRCSSFTDWKYPIDAGAAWIHGVDGNPISSLATTYKFERNWISLNKYPIFDHKGDIAPSEIDESMEILWNFLLDLVKCEEENTSTQILEDNVVDESFSSPPIFSRSTDFSGQSLAESLDRALRNELKLARSPPSTTSSSSTWPEHIIKKRRSRSVRHALSILSPENDKSRREIAIRLLGWNLSHLEYANATDAWNLSKRHWDEDDAGYLFSGT